MDEAERRHALHTYAQIVADGARCRPHTFDGSRYNVRVDDQQQQAIHLAVNEALDELADHLGGTADRGGPVENATQIKGRGDLGILLTDVNDLVLGRVWVAFGAGIDAPDADLQGGGVAIRAEVCSEVVEPPVHLDAWAEGR